MRWRIPLIVALVAFVAVSCDQQPVEPESDTGITTPSESTPALAKKPPPGQAMLLTDYEWVWERHVVPLLGVHSLETNCPEGKRPVFCGAAFSRGLEFLGSYPYAETPDTQDRPELCILDLYNPTENAGWADASVICAHVD